MVNYRNIIKEALGVNEDVRTLSTFIYNHILSNKETIEKKKSKIVYKKDDLPSLKDLNISKIILNTEPEEKTHSSGGKTGGHFDLGKSYSTNNGLVVYLSFFGIPNESTIFHELTHVLQYSKLGKVGMSNVYSKVKSSEIATRKNSLKQHRNVFNDLSIMIYFSNENEVSAKVTETYSKIKREINRAGGISKLKKGGNFNSWMKYLILSSEGWLISEALINYDIFEKFKKIDDEFVIEFFSYLHEIDKDFLNFVKGNSLSKIKHQIIFIVKTILDTHSTKKLSEDEVLRTMKLYNKKINEQGHKLRRKLIKLYGHFN